MRTAASAPQKLLHDPTHLPHWPIGPHPAIPCPLEGLQAGAGASRPAAQRLRRALHGPPVWGRRTRSPHSLWLARSVCGSAGKAGDGSRAQRLTVPMAALCALRPPLRLGQGLARPQRPGGRPLRSPVSGALSGGQKGAAPHPPGGLGECTITQRRRRRAAAAGRAGGRPAAPWGRRPAGSCRPRTLPGLRPGRLRARPRRHF